jgi:SLOG cluster2
MLDPTKTSDLGPPLGGLRVGIAGAVPERRYWGSVTDLDRLILAFVAQLSALVIRYGGTVVHGSQPSLTPVVAEQARLQSPEGISCLTLFASQLFGELPEVASRACRTSEAELVLTRKIGEGDFRDPKTRNDSLTAMRIALTADVDIVVAIGGKLHRDSAFYPGVFEELAQARWRGAACFIVGAFGGAAGQLNLPILEEFSAGNLLDAGDVAPEEMATWTDSMDEYAGKLLAHFARHRDHFIKRRQSEFGSPALRSRIRTEEVVETALGRAARVVTVDPGLVEQWSSRFSELIQAVRRNDSVQARKLLNQTTF